MTPLQPDPSSEPVDLMANLEDSLADIRTGQRRRERQADPSDDRRNTTEDDCGYFARSQAHPCPRCASYNLGQQRSDDRLINVREAAQAVLDSALETFNGNVEVSEESLAVLEKVLDSNKIPGPETAEDTP